MRKEKLWRIVIYMFQIATVNIFLLRMILPRYLNYMVLVLLS